jgi:hypothetical protein
MEMHLSMTLDDRLSRCQALERASIMMPFAGSATSALAEKPSSGSLQESTCSRKARGL